MSAGGFSMETIGLEFIDAFNRRDADGLVALANESIEFHPTALVGERRSYHGHDGLRRWVSDLGSSRIKHQVRVREIRVLDESRFLVLSEVLLDDEVVAPSAMLTRLTDAGLIAEAQAYLTDEHLLTQLGVVPEQPAAGV